MLSITVEVRRHNRDLTIQWSSERVQSNRYFDWLFSIPSFWKLRYFKNWNLFEILKPKPFFLTGRSGSDPKNDSQKLVLIFQEKGPKKRSLHSLILNLHTAKYGILLMSKWHIWMLFTCFCVTLIVQKTVTTPKNGPKYPQKG